MILIPSWYSGKVQDDLLFDSILKTTNAVKNKRIYTYMGWDIATGVVQVPYMAKLFYPDKFKNLNLKKKCNGILKEFYGIDGLYSKMIDNKY